jgi:cytochrome b561
MSRESAVSGAAPNRYTATAIFLHWLVFIMIACGFALAVYMVDLPLSPQKLKYFSWHKWIGVTVFMLALIRVAWRQTHPALALPARMPEWQRRAAAASHVLLYALILVIPVTGWLYSSAAGVPTVYLGMLQLPDLLAKDKALAQQLKLVHVTLNYSMLGLVIIHAAAALKHHFHDRDDVLARMLPWLKPDGKR